MHPGLRWQSVPAMVLLFFAGSLCGAQQPPRPATVPGVESLPAAQTQAISDLQHGRSEAAIAALEKLAQSNSKAKGVEHDLGLAYYRTGRLVSAKQAFAAAIAADPDDHESVQLEGLTLYRLGQPAAAIPFLQQVRTWSPQANADANHVLGLCYLNSGKLDEARGAFAAEYTVPPESGAAYLLLAKMLTTSNLPDQGAQATQRALAVSPNLPLTHLLLGEVALYKSDVAGAIAQFEAERAINPSYAPVYERLADAYLKTDRYDQAQEALM